MTFRLSTPETPGQNSRRWLQLFLLAGFLLSLLIGLGALLGVYLLPELEEETVRVISDPVRLVEPAEIPPHLALLQLAGADDEGLVRQAATAGERGLAYSILIYDGTLTPSRQANELLRVGRLFLAADDRLRAVAAFERARTAALFALPMPPLERGQLLVRSAEGLLQAGNPESAHQSALQAQHVAVQSAGLLPAQRQQILQAAAPIIRAQGSSEEIERLDELLRSPGQSPERVALINRLPELRAEYPYPPELDTLRDQRMAASQTLIERLVATGGQDIDPERNALAQALLAEDALRGQIYAGWNNPALQLDQRHGLLLDYRDWLLVKIRVAEGGFGLRLVDLWERDSVATRSLLGRVMSELSALMQAQIDAETDPLAQAILRLEALQWLTFQAEMGHYPNAPLGDLASRMDQAQAEMERLGLPPDLPLYFDTEAEPPGFRIARRYQ
ncbi:MAG: hypothetical protein WBO46_01100 [Caldilineaceae bacterium]